MGDEQQGHAAFGLLGEQKVGDLAACLGIEIAGRLVGDQQGGRGGERPGDRHALLFAAGKLAGIVVQPFAEADRLQLAMSDLEGVADIGEFERHGDVFQRRHVGDQVEGLEDDADVAAAEIGDLVLAEAMERRIVDVDLTAVELFQPGKHHQQGGFAGTGRADDADGFAGSDIEIDALQHMDGGGCAAEGQIGAFQLDNGFCQQKSPYISP